MSVRSKKALFETTAMGEIVDVICLTKYFDSILNKRSGTRLAEERLTDENLAV